MISRRGFLKRLSGAISAVVAAPHLPEVATLTHPVEQALESAKVVGHPLPTGTHYARFAHNDVVTRVSNSVRAGNFVYYHYGSDEWCVAGEDCFRGNPVGLALDGNTILINGVVTGISGYYDG